MNNENENAEHSDADILDSRDINLYVGCLNVVGDILKQPLNKLSCEQKEKKVIQFREAFKNIFRHAEAMPLKNLRSLGEFRNSYDLKRRLFKILDVENYNIAEAVQNKKAWVSLSNGVLLNVDRRSVVELIQPKQ